VIAAGFVGSFSLGAGQFCTKPGLLLVPAGSGLCDVVAAELERQAPRGWLLTRGIAEACAEGVQRLVRAGATVLTTVSGPPSGWSMPTTLAVAPSSALHTGSPLLDECFGPVALVVEYEPDELPDILAALPGSLAAGVQAGSDDPDVAALVETLAARCGRVLVDDWPTGVAVTWAQHHGGPWPATSTPWATSVGAAALRRFVRPVAFQNVPDTALPAELRDENPWSLPRRVNGAVPA
jgi:NADP-dependent aldehyde dehydrogenase